MKLSYFVLIFTLVTSNAYAERTIIDFAEQFNISNSEANSLVGKLAVIVRRAQHAIAFIGDSSNAYDEKTGAKGVIAYTVKEHFVSENSTVQVSSSRHNSIYKKRVREYLGDLAFMSSIHGKYDQVKISFDDEILFDKVQKSSGDTGIVDLNVWQTFKGCINTIGGGEDCYQGKVKKKISVRIAFNRDQVLDSRIAINSISGRDSYINRAKNGDGKSLEERLSKIEKFIEIQSSNGVTVRHMNVNK
jgi:hypothetical protein